MKLKFLIKRALVYSLIWGVAGFFNYFSLPISFSTYSHAFKRHIRDKKIQQVCKTDSYLENIIADIDVKNCGVLPFVKSSHALTTKHLSYESPSFFNQIFSSREKRIALEKGEADCSFFSAFTYSNFLYLADRFGRQDLKDKVRLCCGHADGMHSWLQVYFNNKWNNYETVIDPLERKDEINFKNLDTKFPNYWVFGYNNNYYPFSYIQFEKGKLANHTKLFSSIEYGVDLIRLLKG